MGLGEAGPEEEGAGGVPGLQEIDGLVGYPGGDAVLFLHGGEHGLHLALPDAVDFRAGKGLLFIIFPHVIQGQLHVFEAVVGSGGVEVHLPLGAGLVAGIGQQGGQSRAVFRTFLHEGRVGAVGGHAALIALQAGHDGRTGGHADGASGIAGSVAGAHGGHVVQVGREDALVPPGVHGVEALLVGGDQQDVVFGHNGLLFFSIDIVSVIRASSVAFRRLL